MGRISGAVRRAPTSAPTNWFADNGLTEGSTPTPSPVNTTQPVGDPVRLNQPGSTGATATREPTPAEVLAIVSQFPPTYEGARQADAELQRQFGSYAPKLLDHPTKLDKWQFSNGQVYDLMNSAGGPGASWVTSAVPESGAHGGGGAPGGVGMAMSTPYQSTAPGAYAGASPGYDFRLKEGLRALQNSAASRGTLLTGGTLKDITRFGQDYASGEFDKDFSRNLSVAQLGFNAANAAAQYGSAYGSQAGNLAGNQAQAGTDLITGGGNVQASGTIGASNANRQTLADVAGIASQIPYYYALLRR